MFTIFFMHYDQPCVAVPSKADGKTVTEWFAIVLGATQNLLFCFPALFCLLV